MLAKGSTAIDGLSGGSAAAAGGGAAPSPATSDRRAPARAMFFSCARPGPRRRASSLPRTCRAPCPETQMPPGLGHRLQPRGDVDAVAVDVAALDDHVAEVDADAQHDARAPRGKSALASAMPLLQFDRAVHRIDRAGELDQHAVAHQLDDAAAMLGDQRVQDPCGDAPSSRRACRPRPLHEPAVADHVGGEDGGEPAFHVHRWRSGHGFGSSILRGARTQQPF